MKERPILFSAPMVRAILDGNKTQTRRVVKPQPILNYQPELYRPSVDEFGRAQWRYNDPTAANTLASVQGPDKPSTIQCKQGAAGNRLWVRETFCETDAGIAYRASTDSEGERCRRELGYKWKPSIFCTRKASRITLEIVAIRVERLQDISEADAADEGSKCEGCVGDNLHGCMDCKENYRILWESINGPGSWDANPFVWCITFKKI